MMKKKKNKLKKTNPIKINLLKLKKMTKSGSVNFVLHTIK